MYSFFLIANICKIGGKLLIHVKYNTIEQRIADPYNGPYSQKWTKIGPGISLTSQTFFFSAFGLQAVFAAENTEYCKEK